MQIGVEGPDLTVRAFVVPATVGSADAGFCARPVLRTLGSRTPGPAHARVRAAGVRVLLCPLAN
jgi:hypothetical protein